MISQKNVTVPPPLPGSHDLARSTLLISPFRHTNTLLVCVQASAANQSAARA